jgi:prepilin-type N-terminal cleavage/methylation domain-containing protein
VGLKNLKGFTLLELMIVVAIVGLLAAVAIPKYGDSLEKANLGSTLGNLASVRSAVSIYYGSYMAFPGTIDPKLQPKMDEAMQGDMPYVKAHFPVDNPPYGNDVYASAIVGDIPAVMGKGWFYCGPAGTVYINSTANDIKHYPYTMY